MKKASLFIFASFILLSCSENSIRSLDFGDFRLKAPGSWKKLKPEACDSNAGIIITKNNDSIFYDYGPYSYSLEENVTIINRKDLNELLTVNPKADTTEFIVIDKNASREDFIKSKISYKKIDGYKAKIVEPKQVGKGMTGVYIDSLKTESIGNIKFNLYGINLKKESQVELLKAIQTLQFRK
ncbi:MULTISPECIES: hypothetical protein [unclassified Chryseobacterium]|uniref:hypothetical protein n=1 Tax=unclassified Chryseobacterium TaxID=2593645 RepID=UPI000E72C7AC|nr:MULTISPECIES: hypothetical protein [unclassified Chryseobacterium]RKE77955.1 hypothetical protein DEU39_3599 [Chryseobacterium sp. AG363]WFB70064.1 hypothetical protein PZ898_11620 [Chryseobacterium sp. WX]